MHVRSVLIALTVLSLLSFHALAAPVGAINGYVRDASGAVVPGASVTLRSVSTNALIKGATDEAGQFRFLQIPPGAYEVTAEARGFRKAVVRDIMLLVEQVVSLDVRLDVGEVTEVVEVSGSAAALIEPEKISTGMNIAPSLVKELPISNRNYDSLSLLTPGAAPAAAGSQGGNIAAAGARPGSINSSIDGINNVNRQVGTSISNFRIADAVQEFAVTTTGQSAEYGRQSGPQVSVVTKSGTNDLHGTAFWFMRNDALEAKNFFANRTNALKRKLRQNQFGATIGGPIKRDKTFFFYSWEALRQNNPTAATLSVVPTAAEKATVTDPTSRKLLDYWPQPNIAGAAAGANNYVANVPATFDDNTHLARIDHSFNAKNRLTGRHIWYGGEQNNAGSLLNIGGSYSKPGAQSFLLSDTHIFSPTFIVEVRAGISRSVTYLVAQDWKTNAAEVLPEVPGLVDTRKVGQLFGGLPTINITGYRSLGGSNTPQNLVINTYDLVVNASKVAPFGLTGHTLKFGMDGRREEAKRLNNGGGAGAVTFRNFAEFAGTCAACTGQSLANTSTILSGTSLAYWYRYPLAFYLQDEWKVKRNFLLTIGLRYELPFGIVEKTDRGTNIMPGIGPVLVGTNKALDIDPSKAGPASIIYRDAPYTLPRAGVYYDNNNFAPVFGFSYSPEARSGPSWLKDGKTVIRGGFRVGYDETYNNVTVNQSINPPWNFSTTQTAGTTQPAAGYRWSAAFDQNIPLITRTTQAPGAPAIGLLFLNGLDIHAPTAYAYNWNLGIQREIAGRASIDVTYLASAGRKFGGYVNPNEPRVVVRDPGFRGAQAPNEQIYPYPHFGRGRSAQFQGNSIYNGLVATWKYRTARSLNIGGSYTWSHSIDTGSSFAGNTYDASTPVTYTRMDLERGNSASDMRQRFLFYYVFALPIGRGRALLGDANPVLQHIAGGWQISGVTTINTGQPFTVWANRSVDFSGFNTLADRPDIIGSGPLAINTSNPDLLFDPAYFGKVGTNFCPGYSAASGIRVTGGCAPAGRVGTSPRNGFYGPGQISFDATLSKRFPLWSDKSGLTFRADFFNMPNHTNFLGINNTMSTGTFGTLSSAGAARVVQFTLRIDF